MKGRFLSGQGDISSATDQLSTVSYAVKFQGAEAIEGRIKVLSGARGLELYEHDKTLTLHLEDGRSLIIRIKTPIDLTDDSWHILINSSI